MKDITKFSRDFWKTAVAYGGSDECVLRHYDVLTERKRGLTYEQIAIKFGLSKRQVIRICTKNK